MSMKLGTQVKLWDALARILCLAIDGVLILGLLVACALIVRAADKPAVPLPPVPVSPADQQLLQAANEKVQQAVAVLQSQMEIVRLRSCLAASLSLAECGPWQQDQKGASWITRMAKPEPKPAPAKEPAKP